jgi:hypothetical protein
MPPETRYAVAEATTKRTTTMATVAVLDSVIWPGILPVHE